MTRRHRNNLYEGHNNDRHHRYIPRYNNDNFSDGQRPYRRPRGDWPLRRYDNFPRNPRNFPNRQNFNRNNPVRGSRRHRRNNDYEKDRFEDGDQRSNQYTYDDYKKGRYDDYGFRL